jgi:hypothetical protein
MAVISKGTTFATGDQVTAGKLNNLADAATFASGAVDNVSTQLSGGAIIVKDGGVTTAKIADDAVTTAKIASSAVTTTEIADNNVTTSKIADSNVTTAKLADSNVTKAKIENVANMKVLGNTSGSSAAPQEVSILDQDDMSSNRATALATQQLIKAYVDNNTPSTLLSATKSSQNNTVNFDVSGYTLSGSGISESSGTVTITGAGLWMLTVTGYGDLTSGGAEWEILFYVDGNVSGSSRIDGLSADSLVGGINFSTLVNSAGSFTIRILADELTGAERLTLSNIKIQAVKLS